MTNKKVTPSTGNVFADLELENADELLVKAELALRITQVIKGHGLTQIAAAKMLGIDQPKVSRLVVASFIGSRRTNSCSFSTRLGMTSRSLSASGPAGAKRVASLSCRPHDAPRCYCPEAAGDQEDQLHAKLEVSAGTCVVVLEVRDHNRTPRTSIGGAGFSTASAQHTSKIRRKPP